MSQKPYKDSYTKYMKAFGFGNYPEALEALDECLGQITPADALDRAYLTHTKGTVFFYLNEMEEMKKAFAEAKAIDNGSPQFTYHTARFLLIQANLPELARAECEGAIANIELDKYKEEDVVKYRAAFEQLLSAINGQVSLDEL